MRMRSDDEFQGYIDEDEGSNDGGDDGTDNDGGHGVDDDGDDGDGMDNGGDGTENDGGNGIESDKDDGGSSDNEDIPEFVGQAGCTKDMSNKSPIDFLQLFLTDEILLILSSRPTCLHSSTSAPMSCAGGPRFSSGPVSLTTCRS